MHFLLVLVGAVESPGSLFHPGLGSLSIEFCALQAALSVSLEHGAVLSMVLSAQQARHATNDQHLHTSCTTAGGSLVMQPFSTVLDHLCYLCVSKSTLT